MWSLQLDEALILFWRLLHLSPPSMFLEDSDLAFKTLSKFPDILALSDDDTVHPVMSQNQVGFSRFSRSKIVFFLDISRLLEWVFPGISDETLKRKLAFRA